MVEVAGLQIELRLNRDGQPRAYLAGTRVRVQDIYVMSEVHGQTPDEIVRSLPHLSLAQVHAALAYFFQHTGEILQELREDEDMVQQFRAMTGPGPVERKLQQSTDANRDSVSP